MIRQGYRGNRGGRGRFLDYPDFLDHRARLLPIALAIAVPLHAQSDPRPNECWGFVFGAWSPSLDWAAAGHSGYTSHAPRPPAPEESSTGGAPRHDAALFARNDEPALVLYPTWWPVGVGIALERQPAEGDTVRGVAYAFVADGRITAPESRILAWRTPCGEPPARSPTRAAPDERRSPPAAPATSRPRRNRAARPR